jgi:hypothetical protein
MKIVVAEGTPEELATYEQLTGWPQSPQTDDRETAASNNEEATIFEFLMSRAGTKRRFDAAEAFVNAAMSRGDLDAEPGRSETSKDGLGSYLRLYRVGPRRTGAVVYFTPASGVVDVRLPKEAAESRPAIEIRNPDREDPYNIRVRIDSPESIDLALTLLDEAIQLLDG